MRRNFSEGNFCENFSLERGTMLVALLTVIMVIPKKTYQSAVLKTLFIKKWAEGRRFENIKKMVKAKILNWDFLEKFGHFAQKFDSDFWEEISVYAFQALLPHQSSERSKKTQKNANRFDWWKTSPVILTGEKEPEAWNDLQLIFYNIKCVKSLDFACV